MVALGRGRAEESLCRVIGIDLALLAIVPWETTLSTPTHRRIVVSAPDAEVRRKRVAGARTALTEMRCVAGATLAFIRQDIHVRDVRGERVRVEGPRRCWISEKVGGQEDKGEG